MKERNAELVAHAIEKEHQELGERFRRMRELIVTDFFWDEIERALEDLHERVCRHFALEEEGGYMSDVLRNNPNLDPDVNQLRLEHVEMRIDLTDLVEKTRTRSGRDVVRRCFQEWLHRQQRHEAKENRLFQLAMNTDIGNKD
ncbi:MAG: hemerythrin domain-containing protein [Planctomycetota bacterium]